MIQLKTYTTAYVSSGNSLSVLRPTGTIREGDMLVAHVIAHDHGNNVAVSSWPSGWVRRTDMQTSSNSQAILYKVATANEPNSYTFSFPIGGGHSIYLAHYTYDGEGAILKIAASATGTSTVSSSVDVAEPYLFVVYFTGHLSSAKIGSPSGLSLAWNNNFGAYTPSSVSYKWMPSGGNSGTYSASSATMSVSIAIGIDIINEPPTAIGNLSGVIREIYIIGETINISWDASTDPEGEKVIYEVDFYDGNSWITIESGTENTSLSYTFPSGVITDNAKFRVRAKDVLESTSAYTESKSFFVRRQVFLVKDNGTIKTYKNGTWRSI